MVADIHLLFDMGLIIAFATILSYVARSMKQPLIVAYVVAGILLGPTGLKLITSSSEIITLAELGVAFLLFGVGLEIDYKSLKNVGLVSAAGAFIEIVLTFILGYTLALLFSLPPAVSIYIGLLVSFSSTMIVTKLLVDKNELRTLHGRIMIGILIFQDIAAVLALSYLGSLNSIATPAFGLVMLKGIGMFVLALIMNRFFFPRVLDYAAKEHDVFFLTAITTFFFFIAISYISGFSIAIGAFIAGLALANFPYNVEIIGEARALRDFFSTIFFATLGMQLNIFAIKEMPLLFISIFLMITILKPIILIIIYSLLGYGSRTSLDIGLGLGQGSEFMFIISSLGLGIGHISKDIYSLIIAVIVISIVMTPYMIKVRDFINYRVIGRSRRLSKSIRSHALRKYERAPKNMQDHIILIGCHRTGSLVINYLKNIGYKFIAIDHDPEIIKSLIKEGVYAIYGDAENIEVLMNAGIEHARMVVLAIPDVKASLFVASRAKQLNPSARILAIAHTEDEAKKLHLAGCNFVIIPEIASSEKLVDGISYFIKGMEK